jgi:predicted aminopeptidase
MFLIFVAALFLGYGTAYVSSAEVRYLTRAGIEETRILQARRPIAKVVSDPDLDPATRGSLTLVLEARDYAARLGLEAKQTYTTYADIQRDTLLLVLSAAPKDCICPHTWKYPIVGRVPYKGFFDAGMARKEADKLAAEGFDIHLRPAAAFSTLGWFNDPLLSTALTRDSVELAALVFHEITHNTIYVKSAAAFNESFAQLVGYRAAEEFFRARGDTVAARRAADRWHDESVLEEFYATLIGRLDSLYGSKPAPAELEAGRAAASRWVREQLEGPIGSRLRTFHIGRLTERPVNNAQLVGARLYRTNLALFDRWYERNGGDVSRTVAAMLELMKGVEGDSAFARLQQTLGPTDSTAALAP